MRRNKNKDLVPSSGHNWKCDHLTADNPDKIKKSIRIWIKSVKSDQPKLKLLTSET